MKSPTPDSTKTIENVLQDPANALSINSTDSRVQIISKSTNSETLVKIPNADGSVTGVTLPAGYQGIFSLPFVLGSGGITSSGLSEFFLVKDGVAADTNPAYGITRTVLTNNGKLYYTNSSGYLAKVPNSSTPRINYGKNITTGAWEKKGLLLEPRTYNILATTWTSGATFGVTGALVEIAPTSEYSGYWDTSTIPNGLSVWKLTEVPTSGFSAENTTWIMPSRIASGLPLPINLSGPGTSFSNFMVSAFFTGPNKIAGITKDVVQIWMATNPAGTVKKSVYFNISDCSPVSVSTGGITLVHYNTEKYENGWCRCFAGIGYTGATYPTSGGIPQFGFSTARPDGAGGYTFGRLLGASAGSLYFSGIKIDIGTVNDLSNTITQWNSQKLAPTSYVDPNGTTIYYADDIQYKAKPYPNWFYPVGSVTGGFAVSVFYDFIMHGAAGISGTDTQSSGWVYSTSGRFLDENGNATGQLYTGLVGNRGLTSDGIPPWRANFYHGIYMDGGTFAGVKYPTKTTIALSHQKTKYYGITYGERIKLLFVGATGDQRSYMNGLTGISTSFAGPTYPDSISAGQEWRWIQDNLRDKLVNILNWSWIPKALTEDQGIASTSFSAQGNPRFNVVGSDGGYNSELAEYQSISDSTNTIDNTSSRLSNTQYPPEAIP